MERDVAVVSRAVSFFSQDVKQVETMPGFGAEIEVARSMDQLYPQRELEFLSQNGAQDPLLFKVSELVYRQCQKENERKKVRIGQLLMLIYFQIVLTN